MQLSCVQSYALDSGSKSMSIKYKFLLIDRVSRRSRAKSLVSGENRYARDIGIVYLTFLILIRNDTKIIIFQFHQSDQNDQVTQSRPAECAPRGGKVQCRLPEFIDLFACSLLSPHSFRIVRKYRRSLSRKRKKTIMKNATLSHRAKQVLCIDNINNIFHCNL